MWSRARLYSAPPMTLTMYEPLSAARTIVAGSHSVLSLLITETDCPALSGAFLRQPVWSWLAALWLHVPLTFHVQLLHRGLGA